ncbi:hypothetical protein V8C37DRAFT_256327 [Trichoderma ceciliae]
MASQTRIWNAPRQAVDCGEQISCEMNRSRHDPRQDETWLAKRLLRGQGEAIRKMADKVSQFKCCVMKASKGARAKQPLLSSTGDPPSLWRGDSPCEATLVGEAPKLLGFRYAGCPIAGEADDVLPYSVRSTWRRGNAYQPRGVQLPANLLVLPVPTLCLAWRRTPVERFWMLADGRMAHGNHIVVTKEMRQHDPPSGWS